MATSDIASLLKAWQQGDAVAQNTLFEMLYVELGRISAALLNKEGGISLSTGDLVNEAALRLINLNKIEWQDKTHFLALSAKVMRQVLIDHSRKKMAHKRHHQKVTLLTNMAESRTESVDLQHLEEALQELQSIDPERVRIVEMRYYGGLSLQQISDLLGVSPSTTKRSWRASRAWLLNTLEAKTSKP